MTKLIILFYIECKILCLIILFFGFVYLNEINEFTKFNYFVQASYVFSESVVGPGQMITMLSFIETDGKEIIVLIGRNNE